MRCDLFECSQTLVIIDDFIIKYRLLFSKWFVVVNVYRQSHHFAEADQRVLGRERNEYEAA